MATIDLEFRGISIAYLGLYFEELGAKQKTDSFPFIYEAESWSGQILSEKEITFTETFKVNAAKVRFKADTDTILEALIKNYRYKTTRIGG
ncbi:hypothetical protein J1P26_16195 [Neobacillus sp. MM2021_6]|uniref:hypothetical protein n=1 Tax=Bacillaceae TaxID=186817 RepID=UPI00140D042A|nr:MULTISPECIES: hypothetical protein [Bacillaceae]MBO0961245.1 hypothetical protein [Neobacillus sp. MM2021_6]NHC18736.1 hypothetical protein [Bacillus sp. MM2020_4]WML38748.1 hypothetical protein RCG19_16300 [Neobacillus sp. OS1-2]